MNTSERRFRESFLATAAPDLAPVLDEHLESDRSHLHSYHSSIWIPMTQSIVTALLFALDVLIVIYCIKNGLFNEAWAWAVMTFFAVMTISWLLLLERWLNLTMPLERFLKRDINGDGFIGQAPARVVRVEIKTNPKQMIYTDLPDTPAAHEFYRAILQGFSTAEREWVGAGKPLEPGIYDAIRSEMLNRHLAHWMGKDVRQGWALTELGRTVLKELITTPPPQDENA